MQQLLIDARQGLVLNIDELAKLDAQTIEDVIDITEQVIDSINLYTSNLSSLDKLSREVSSFVADASSSSSLSSVNLLVKNTMDTVLNAASYSGTSSVGTLNTDAAAYDWTQTYAENTTSSETISSTFGSGLTTMAKWVGKINKTAGQTIGAIAEIITSALFYTDGVTETRYGLAMERSWSGGSNSFLKTLNSGSYTVDFTETTPLDPSSSNSANLYGNLLLGGPPLFNQITDPNNRVTINTFVKDSVFLSLTPGLPKFNGGSFSQSLRSGIFNNTGGTYLNQTEGTEEAMAYLLKNGLDADFAEKDRRYYTFQAKYNQYYSYLETMLNAMWIKLGLGTKEENKFSLFSFFNSDAGTLDYEETLQEKYKSSLGFYVTMSAVSEAVSNQELSVGLESQANTASDQFQRLNYITGMGTDKIGAGRRVLGVANEELKVFDSTMRNIGLSKSGQDGSGNSKFKITDFIKAAGNIATSQDLSSIVQAFSVTNGMRVMYPNLWQSSNYSKNLNFNFNFISPYGDPLSIFQYVYVPFFSLLAFALPRQAAQNGYVSPFFIRGDIPGLFTSDLALISDLTWIRGGDGNLWTKDKLPRSISGSFTITDLYPYLTMVKRLSFLSANPSFTVFLDNMAGLGALYNNGESDSMNKYWKQMINRVSGESNSSVTGELWNDFSQDKRDANTLYATRDRKKVGRTLNMKSVPWMSKI